MMSLMMSMIWLHTLNVRSNSNLIPCSQAASCFVPQPRFLEWTVICSPNARSPGFAVVLFSCGENSVFLLRDLS